MKNRMPRGLKFALIAIAAPIGIALILGLLGWIVMHLWNWLIPAMFGLKSITFWQAVALLILCRLLFGGMRGGPGRSGGGHWRHRMKERWQQMTPQERERFLEEGDGRWGCGRSPQSEVNPGA